MEVIATFRNIKQTIITIVTIAIRKAITVEIISSPMTEERSVTIFQEDTKIKDYCTRIPKPIKL